MARGVQTGPDCTHPGASAMGLRAGPDLGPATEPKAKTGGGSQVTGRSTDISFLGDGMEAAGRDETELEREERRP